MEDCLYYFENTEYPHLYKNTYWGSFEVEDEVSDEVIFRNRNLFVRDFNIQSRLPSSTYSEHSEVSLDNLEIYTTLDGTTLAIISPHIRFYNISQPGTYNSIKEDVYTKAGWTKIYPLYSTKYITWIKGLKHQRCTVQSTV